MLITLTDANRRINHHDMTTHLLPETTENRLSKLKTILQEDLTPRAFERLTAALLSELLGLTIAIAKSGFQHGGDAGPGGRQGRRFRIETKRYADETSLSDRELLGEIDHAVKNDPAIGAWFLTATRSAPEQPEQDLLRKSDALGLPVAVIDWKPDGFPALAALCTSAPHVIETMVSKEAGDLARSLASEGEDALSSLRRDLASWNLGFERLRALSLERLTTIWTTPRTSMAALGQDAAGGHHPGTIRRQRSFAALSAWWNDRAMADAPAAVVGWEGVGKTWAALDWLTDRQAKMPIVLVVPSSAVAGIASVSGITVMVSCAVLGRFADPGRLRAPPVPSPASVPVSPSEVSGSVCCSIPLGLNFGLAFSPLSIAISSRNCPMSSACRRCSSSSCSIRPSSTSTNGVRSASPSIGRRFGSTMFDR